MFRLTFCHCESEKRAKLSRLTNCHIRNASHPFPPNTNFSIYPFIRHLTLIIRFCSSGVSPVYCCTIAVPFFLSRQAVPFVPKLTNSATSNAGHVDERNALASFQSVEICAVRKNLFFIPVIWKFRNYFVSLLPKD